jgi:hypothetical protein
LAIETSKSCSCCSWYKSETKIDTKMKVNQESVIPILGRSRSLVLLFDVHEKFHFLFHLTSRYVPHRRKSFARLWRKAQGLGGWLPSENSVEIPMI